MKIFFLILFSLFLISFVHYVAAEQIENDITSLVQIIHRDNDGNLIGYLEYVNYVNILNIDGFYAVMTASNAEFTPVEINGKQFELFQLITPSSPDPSGLISTTNTRIVGNDGITYKAMNILHDGIRLATDEHIDVIWNFLRPI